MNDQLSIDYNPKGAHGIPELMVGFLRGISSSGKGVYEQVTVIEGVGAQSLHAELMSLESVSDQRNAIIQYFGTRGCSRV